MGNQLLKGYTIQGEPVNCVGNEKMWRIYQGLKNGTNTAATIFAIEKRALNKSDRDELIKFAKKQAMGLARIRHPGVLAISETLIEDENILAFSTEQVIGNLAMLSKENRLKQIISNEIELRLNLFPLLDTIQFLHENVKTVHLSINFDNIYITKEGKWKISGFSNSQIYSSEEREAVRDFRCSDYAFCSPEVVYDKQFDKKSDVYSLGLIIVNLLQVLSGQYTAKSYKSQSDYKQSFEKDLIKKINSEQMEKIQNFRELKSLLKNLFAKQSNQRAQLQDIISSKWLNDRLVITVRYLENITNYDNKQQIQFLKGLMGILNHFDSRILMRKVVPLLMDLLKFKHLIPYVIYISIEMLKDGKIIKPVQFEGGIWPHFRKVLQGKEMTANSIVMFVENMPLLEKTISLQELVRSVVPLYIKCFDCPPKLKDLALKKTDYILSKMDYQFIKSKMIPKIMSCIKDSNADVHKNGLIALRKCIKILDTQTITSIVLPGLENSRKAGSDPFINAITVSIYGMLGKSLPSEVISSKLIPTVLPYLTDSSVSSQDFYNYKKALMVMLEKIESERKKYWEQKPQSNSEIFTEKDFQFAEEKKPQQSENNIGKGDYNFLANYGSTEPPPQKSQPQQAVSIGSTFTIEGSKGNVGNQGSNMNINVNTHRPNNIPETKISQNSDPWANLSSINVSQSNFPLSFNSYENKNNLKSNEFEGMGVNDWDFEGYSNQPTKGMGMGMGMNTNMGHTNPHLSANMGMDVSMGISTNKTASMNTATVGTLHSGNQNTQKNPVHSHSLNLNIMGSKTGVYAEQDPFSQLEQSTVSFNPISYTGSLYEQPYQSYSQSSHQIQSHQSHANSSLNYSAINPNTNPNLNYNYNPNTNLNPSLNYNLNTNLNYNPNTNLNYNLNSNPNPNPNYNPNPNPNLNINSNKSNDFDLI